MSDAELISACRRGDARAWRALLDRYESLVYSIPLSFGLTRDDAADVTQATFGVFLDSFDRITEPDRLGAWLSTVAKRQSIRIIERRDRDRRLEQADPMPGPSEDEQLRIVEDAQWLHRGLALLNERCRVLITRLYLGGDEPSYEAVSAELGMPVGSIGPTRARCLESLRRHLGEAAG